MQHVRLRDFGSKLGPRIHSIEVLMKSRGYSNMKISIHWSRLRSVISVFLVNVAIMCIYAFVNLREHAPSRVKPFINLSGLNCTLDAAFVRVKTTNIWDSRVVEVMNKEYKSIEEKKYNFKF